MGVVDSGGVCDMAEGLGGEVGVGIVDVEDWCFGVVGGEGWG
jgi:hypothetical protein